MRIRQGAFLEREYRDATDMTGLPTGSTYPTKDAAGNALETEFGLSVYNDHQVCCLLCAWMLLVISPGILVALSVRPALPYFYSGVPSDVHTSRDARALTARTASAFY